MGLPESRQLLEKRTEVFEVLLFSVTSAAGVRAKIHSNSAMVEKKNPDSHKKTGADSSKLEKPYFHVGEGKNLLRKQARTIIMKK